MLGNTTLESLTAEDLASLTPHLTEGTFDRGAILTEQGDDVETIYFPASAQLANVLRFTDGSTSESFFMGTEGVSGLAAFLADEPCAWSVEVRVPGRVYALPAGVLRDRFRASETLRTHLLRLAYDYQVQSALAAGCSHKHTVPARLASTLAIMSDKLDHITLELTQDDLGRILGVQRTSINAGSIALRASGAIKYSRGQIRIADREKLRQAACECLDLYEMIKHGREPQSEGGAAG